ncbi:competence protein ComK [Bacillus marinisedimentorum]|uniref:competence protein ComK n=1 Tax=Bacillus marinisedimentorum TaxID=1821260 RepID=UPI0009F70F67|nr:competence protein ComK [Bacillus marinisedimentorum]
MEATTYPLPKNTFEVNVETMAVIAEKDDCGEMYTKVIQVKDEFSVGMRPLAIIEKSCRYFGSSLKGRQDGTREITGFTHKAPVAIDPASGIYMFPTLSPYKEECSWLSHSYIKQLEAMDAYRTKIVFLNDKEVILNVSKGSFENQLHRTAQFRFLLSEKIKSLTFAGVKEPG